MLGCTEINSLIIAVYPVDRHLLDFPMPDNVQVETINISSIKFAGTSTGLTLDSLRSKFQGFVVGTTYIGTSVREEDVEVEPGISIKANYKRIVAGDYYQVHVSAKTTERISSVKPLVDSLSDADVFDLFIVDADDKVYLVRGLFNSSSATLSQVLPSSDNNEVSIELMSVSGIVQLQA